MARFLERVYSPDRLLQPMKRVGPQGGRAVRADRLGRGARHHRPEVRRDRPARAMARRRSCPTAITGRWASSRPAASTGGFFTGWGPRCSTGPSAPRPARLGYEYTVGRGRFGADPLAVPECKFIVNWGSNTANTNSHLWSLMIEARKAGATDRDGRPVSEPDRPPLRLVHPAAPRHRRGAGPGTDARDLARRPSGRRLPEQGDGRRRAAAPAGHGRVSARNESRRSPGSTSRRSRPSPIAWPASSRRSSGSTTACSAIMAAAWPCAPSPACRRSSARGGTTAAGRSCRRAGLTTSPWTS